MPQLSISRRHAVFAGMASAGLASLPQRAASQATTSTRIHRVEDSTIFPVNAFVVEGPDAVVVVDGSFVVPGAAAIRERVAQTGKPLAGILLTHAHPDHYAGLGAVRGNADIPIISLGVVADAVTAMEPERTDPTRAQLGELFPEVVFPTQRVSDGDVIDLGAGLRFEFRFYGPAESPADGIILLQDSGHVFCGDIVYGLMHSFMMDNYLPEWQRVLDRLTDELPEDTVLHVGHGPAMTPGIARWQSDYLRLFEEAVLAADFGDMEAASNSVISQMQSYLPTEDLLLFLQLSIEPNAQRLGRI